MAAARRAADARVRPDRDHGQLDVLPPRPGRPGRATGRTCRSAPRCPRPTCASWTAGCGRCRLGGTGELYIGGDQPRPRLPRPARPDRATLRRRPGPGPAPGQRLYRTGDLVRQRADGNLEFLSPGRHPDQDPRLPGGTDGDRVDARPAPGRRRVGGHAPTSRRPVTGGWWPTSCPRHGAGAAASPSCAGSSNASLPAYMVPVRVRRARRAAAERQRQGRPRTGCPRPTAAGRSSAEEYVAPQTPVRAASWPTSWPPSSGSARSASTTTSSRSAATRSWPSRSSPGRRRRAAAVAVRPVRPSDGRRRWPRWPPPGRPSTPSRATSPARCRWPPTQRWFCAAGIEEPHHWNTSVLLELGARRRPELLRDAVEHLLAPPRRPAPAVPAGRRAVPGADRAARRRDAVRGARPVRARRGRTGPPAAELAGADAARSRPRRRAAAAGRAVPARRPAARPAGHRRAPAGGGRRVDAADPGGPGDRGGAASAGEEVAFLPKTTSWQSWGRRLAAYARDGAGRGAARVLDGAGHRAAGGCRSTAGRRSDTEASARTVAGRWAARRPTSCCALPADALDAGVEELLLAALGRTLAPGPVRRGTWWTSSGTIGSTLFEDVDLTRTVGWFSRAHPLALTAEPGRLAGGDAADGQGGAALRFPPAVSAGGCCARAAIRCRPRRAQVALQLPRAGGPAGVGRVHRAGRNGRRRREPTLAAAVPDRGPGRGRTMVSCGLRWRQYRRLHRRPDHRRAGRRGTSTSYGR